MSVNIEDKELKKILIDFINSEDFKYNFYNDLLETCINNFMQDKVFIDKIKKEILKNSIFLPSFLNIAREYQTLIEKSIEKDFLSKHMSKYIDKQLNKVIKKIEKI